MTGSRLRAAREDAGLSLRQLAAISGMSVSKLSRIELGQQDLRIEQLKELAAILGVRAASLLGAA